jgi:photosystem II stability/assembly factor-like uncharacterized protein
MTMKTMKYFSKFVVGILLLLSYPLNSHSQQGWFQQVSGTTLNLYSVYFIDANTGFAAGDTGVILRTVNGGSNWTIINSGTNKRLNQIMFINSTTGFAPSDTVTYRSSDCGVTWSYIIHGVGMYVSFINQTTGFAFGSPVILCKTTNSGLSWSTVAPFWVVGGVTRICFRNENTGYASGWVWNMMNNTYSALIRKTSDSGYNWANIYTGLVDGWAVISDCNFISDSFGVALEVEGYNYSFHKTTNAGQNWNQVTLPQQMNSVRFTDVNKGWTCGVNGTILYTSNGGTNWGAQLSGVSVQLNYLYMLNQNTGWIVGNNGTILSTTNGGVHGIKQISNEVPSVYKLYQNYPNPFNPSTKFKILIAKLSDVNIVVYDLLGREIATLVNEQLKPGSYEVEWDGSNYPSGVYIYRLKTESFSETKKMILLK